MTTRPANQRYFTSPTPYWSTRRIFIDNHQPCQHCGGNAFLHDPDLGITCTLCSKPPHPTRPEEPPFP